VQPRKESKLDNFFSLQNEFQMGLEERKGNNDPFEPQLV
jgi:hypothetical protein